LLGRLKGSATYLILGIIPLATVVAFLEILDSVLGCNMRRCAIAGVVSGIVDKVEAGWRGGRVERVDNAGHVVEVEKGWGKKE